MTFYPKISIITPSYNQAEFIEETILSIVNQNYPNLEYIIIDGGSTDNTLEIIKKYEQHLKYWVSEKDNGQTHAINKGFKLATGEIFAYLNSDDCYYPDTLELIGKTYLSQNKSDDFLFIGQCYWAKNFDDKEGSLDIPDFPQTLKKALLKTGLAPQPSMFWTMRNNQLSFCDSLVFCMDYEFWLQLIVNKYKVINIDICLSLFRQHPNAKTQTIKHILMDEAIGLNFIYRKHLSLPEVEVVAKFNHHQIERSTYYSIDNRKSKLSFTKHCGQILNANLSLILKSKLLIKSMYARFKYTFN